MRISRALLSSLLTLASLGAGLGCSHTAPSTSAASQPEKQTSPYSVAAMPPGEKGSLVHLGREIFDHTPQMAGQYVGAKVSCGDCHIKGGTAGYSAPMIDLAGIFPMFNKRAGHEIDLQERIQECFTRSENGKPLPRDTEEMKALTAYIDWLSRDGIKGKPYKERGFVKVADLEGNPTRGQQVYASQCAGCHGTDGAGVPPILPPVWGPNSYNDGAGMNNPKKMTGFLMHNMPQNHPGSLTQQQAWDVSAYVHSMPRPKFNEAYKIY